ncbi:MAG: phosphoribosylglycinamide formyltransferase [Aquificae bacterium]|nr:phosphoribosylglycinamide formyltransferase [Aquificota bacterium]
MNIGILISGRGSNLEAILKAKNAGKIKSNIRVVLSNNPNAQGLKIAKNYGIKTFYIDPNSFESRESFDQKLIEILQNHSIDLVVLAGYMRILSDRFIEEFEGKLINIHPSLLPAFQGLKPQKRALEYGAKYSGCTVHFVTKELDSGPIIIQAVVPILPDDTEETLSKKILKYEHRIYPQVIKWIEDGRIKQNGRKVIVKNARYGTLPTNPALEDF